MRDKVNPVYVYILKSEADRSYYCGHTNDLRRRMNFHNLGHHRATRGRRPWKLVHAYLDYSREEAMKLEYRIKRRGVKRFLKDLNKTK